LYVSIAYLFDKGFAPVPFAKNSPYRVVVSLLPEPLRTVFLSTLTPNFANGQKDKAHLVLLPFNLTKVGYREREMAEELLKAWREQGLPDDFDNDSVIIMMNFYSGNVFLTNADYQVAMIGSLNTAWT